MSKNQDEASNDTPPSEQAETEQPTAQTLFAELMGGVDPSRIPQGMEDLLNPTKPDSDKDRGGRG